MAKIGRAVEANTHRFTIPITATSGDSTFVTPNSQLRQIPSPPPDITKLRLRTVLSWLLLYVPSRLILALAVLNLQP
jgi:hypothetical protein